MYLEPEESSKYPGFFKIPGLDHHAISRKGKIINLKTGTILSQRVNTNGYAQSSLRGEKVHIIRIHRTLALTFLPHPENTDDLVVNHIDGNKLNNTLSNLEWCTHQENCEHAGARGLSNKCVPIQTRDTKTGEVTNYPSIMSCVMDCGLQYGEISARLRYGADGARVFPEHKQYRYASEDTWPEPVYDKKLLRKCKGFNVVTKEEGAYGRAIAADARNVKTGEVKTFSKISDLAKFLGRGITSTWTLLTRKHQPVVDDLWQIKRASDKFWRPVTDPIKEHYYMTGQPPVQIYNPVTGETRIFETSLKCAKAMDIRPNALFCRLNASHVKKDYTYPDGWMYGYYPLFEGKSYPLEMME